MRLVVLIVGFVATCVVMASAPPAPWKNPEAPLIIDCYHANNIDWALLGTEPRVAAIIHKATVGSKKIDPKYHARRQEAKQRGYLWGSYHLGLAGHPEQQADHYLKTVKPGPDDLIALDLEDVTSKRFMNANEATRFIQRVKQQLGRYPVVYVNRRSARHITNCFKDTVFAHTPLWYANFTDTIDNLPEGVWPGYTLWQFSSEILIQQPVPGTETDMDVNVFNGSMEDLKAKWPFTSGAPGEPRS
jgi:GH25 family lysozyme M1 (1,4-beta-N-acetylmuramidase)